MRRIAAPLATPFAVSLSLLFTAAMPSSAVAQVAQTGQTAQDFIYRAQPRDTLIGLGRRLLLEPNRWPELQRLNHIVDPRRIPLGSSLRIPYEWLRTSAEAATVANLSGTVQAMGRKITQGEVLPQGSVVETGADGSVTIDLADGSVVTLQKSSVLTFDQMLRVTGVDAAHSIRLKLGVGRIETAVKPHRDVGRFEIVTPVAVAAVRGTRFRDSFSGDSDLATTETLEGTVSVSGNAASVPVAAGFGTRVARNQPPLQPVALLPPPDLSGIPQINTGTPLRIEFGAVAGARGYRVQLSTDAQFHAIAADTLTDGNAASLVDLPDGEYWLRVRAVDELGIEGMDAVRQMARHVLPEPPAPIEPAGAARITGAHARYAWASAGPGSHYALQVARDPAFAAPVIARTHLDTNSVDIDDMAPGRYFWRVATESAGGETGPWSEVRSHAQRSAMPMPDPPQLTGHQLRFGWQAVPDQRYRMQIARDENFDDIVLDRRSDEPQWSMRKLPPGTYFVRIQGIDPDGGAGPFGPARQFAIPIPLWLKIAGPLAFALALTLLQ